jgi:hypothetical protein
LNVDNTMHRCGKGMHCRRVMINAWMQNRHTNNATCWEGASSDAAALNSSSKLALVLVLPAWKYLHQAYCKTCLFNLLQCVACEHCHHV